jgi:hypothetical protein
MRREIEVSGAEEDLGRLMNLREI